MKILNIFKSTSRVIYMILVILFVVYLVFSNFVMAKIISDNQPKSDVLDNYEASNQLLFVFNGFDYDKITGEVSYDSWAFCPSDKPNENREAKMFFVSDSNTYSINLEAKINRIDVRGALYEDHLIPSATLGVSQRFNVVNLPNDTYEIYIYVKENEEISGIAPTGFYYQKNGRSFEEVEFISEKTDISIDMEKLQVADSSVNIVIEDENLSISGWAFIDDIDTSMQKVTLLISDEKSNKYAYTTAKTNRLDVVNYFNNDLYTYSGFDANIPTNDLPIGNYTATLIVENGDILMKTTNYSFTISD